MSVCAYVCMSIDHTDSSRFMQKRKKAHAIRPTNHPITINPNPDPRQRQQVLSYTKQLLGGLEFLAAQDIIHCDLKPDNLVVNHNLSLLKVGMLAREGRRRGMHSIKHQACVSLCSSGIGGGREGRTHGPTPFIPLTHTQPGTPTIPPTVYSLSLPYPYTHTHSKPITQKQTTPPTQICDFGSAMRAREMAELGDAPYLQSRFYRAPENILGYDPRVRCCFVVVVFFLGGGGGGQAVFMWLAVRGRPPCVSCRGVSCYAAPTDHRTPQSRPFHQPSHITQPTPHLLSPPLRAPPWTCGPRPAPCSRCTPPRSSSRGGTTTRCSSR